MPLPVTTLAGSDAYLGHEKAKCRRVCKFFGTSDRLSELRRLFSYRTASVLREYGQTVPATFEETVVVTVQFTHECVEFSTVIPRLQCLVHSDTSLASILSPLSAVNSFAYRCPFPAGLSPSLNATAGGKVSRRAIYRRNTA